MALSLAGRWGPDSILDRYGNGVTAATVYVFESDGVTLATLYSDKTKAVEVDNPTLTDSVGNLDFFTVPGQYVIEVVVGGATLSTLDVLVHAHPDDLASIPASDDHGTFTGLGDDDHSQYLNAARHDSDDHSAVDHGGILGLADDDHTQYLNVARHDSDDHSSLGDVKKSLFTAKGDVLGASAASTPVALGLGVDGQVLSADSAEASGLKWVTNPAGVTDHGVLTGLADDDHTQYFNETRHDADDHSSLTIDHGATTGLADDDHTQYLNTTRHDAHDHTTALGTASVADLSDVSAFLDEDDLVSDSATAIATQQSIKAYVDTEIAAIPTSSTPTVVIKGSDESVTSSTTLQNDDALLVAVASSTVYVFEAVLWVVSSDTPDIKLAFTVPSGATLRWSGMHAFDNPTHPGGFEDTATITASGTAASLVVRGTALRPVIIRGYVSTAGTSGNLQLQWAQVISDATSATIKAGSSLTLIPAS